MRIVHLSSVHARSDPRINKQLQAAREAGHDVGFVVQHDRDARVDGVAVHALPRARSRWSRPRVVAQTLRRALRLEADLYHFHDPELIPVAWRLHRRGARVVYDKHEDYGARPGLEGAALRAAERWCWRWVDGVVLAWDAPASARPPAGVAALDLPNYPAAPARAPRVRTRLEEPVRLLVSGVVSETRGVLRALRALTALRQGGIRATLTIAGVCYRPRDRAAAERYIAAHGLDDVVHLAGWDRYLDPADVARHTDEADLGLVLMEPTPGYAGTIPTKFYSFLQHGLPFIASDMPRWRAFVEAHACGRCVPWDEPAAVAPLVRRWLDDAAAYRACAASAREAAPRYTWEALAPRLDAFYRDVLGAASGMSV